MKNLLLFLSFLTTFATYSQSLSKAYHFGANTSDILDGKYINNGLRDEEDREIDLSVTKGSPYLTKNFENAVISVTNKEEQLGYLMRYNIYDDQMEVMDVNKDMIVSVHKNKDYICKLGNKTFVLIEYRDENNILKKGYFQKLMDGKVDLLLKYSCNYQKKIIGKPPVYKVKPAKFTNFKSFYLFDENKLTVLSTRKSKFLNAFGSHKSKIKKYIKDNKLKIKKDKDLIKIVMYYNSIL